MHGINNVKFEILLWQWLFGSYDKGRSEFLTSFALSVDARARVCLCVCVCGLFALFLHRFLRHLLAETQKHLTLNKERPTWCHLLFYFIIYCSTCFGC